MGATVAELLDAVLHLGDPAAAPREGWVTFEGEVLLEGGGAAAVRSSVGAFDLSDRAGIELEVRGDGRAYVLAVRTDPWFDDVAYHSRFETRPGDRTVHRLPFTGFRATWRGRPVPGASFLSPDRVCAFALLAEERPAGAFRLEIASIRAYGGGRRGDR